MKRIINNRLYDTTKANPVAEWGNKLPQTDPGWLKETLYRKRTGEYFLYGEGGQETQYAQSLGQNLWKAGWKITPLTFTNAKRWAEQRLTPEEYDNAFGIPEERSPDTIVVRLPADVAALVRNRASELGMSVSAYTALLIRKALNW